MDDKELKEKLQQYRTERELVKEKFHTLNGAIAVIEELLNNNDEVDSEEQTELEEPTKQE